MDRSTVIEQSANTLQESENYPLALYDSWLSAHYPFLMVAPEGVYVHPDDNCGCLSMIRQDFFAAMSPTPLTGLQRDVALENAIRADDRIPPYGDGVDEHLDFGIGGDDFAILEGEDFPLTGDHVPLFAAWRINIEEYWYGDRTVDNVVPTDEEVAEVRREIMEFLQ